MGLFDGAFDSSGSGLLGNLNDPQQAAQLSMALGLLQAGSPSRTPIGLGQALAHGVGAGMQAFETAKKNKLDIEKEQMQMDLLKQQVAQATRKNNLVNNMLEQYSGIGGGISAATKALSDGAKVGDIGPTVTNVARMDRATAEPQSGASTKGIPRTAIAHDLAFNDGKNIAEWMFKRGVPDMQVHNGYAYDKNNLQPGFLPGLSVSQNGQATITMPDGRGGVTVSAPPGALDTFGDYKRLEEENKANFNLLPLEYARRDGSPVGGSVGSYLRGPQQPERQSSPAASRNFPAVSTTEQASRDDEALRYAKQDIDNATTPQAKAAAQKVYDTMVARRNAGQSVMTGDAASGGGLQSAAEKEAAVGREKAKNAAFEKKLKDDQERLDKATSSYQRITAAIPMARELLKKATGSGAGAMVDSALGFFGKSTESGESANQLDTLSGWLVSNVPRMEGPQSNLDVNNYQVMAAMVGDRTKPVEARLKALETLESLQKKYAHLNGIQVNEDAAQKKWSDYGYSNQQAAIRDAQNAIMRNPSAKAEVIRRLESAGITNHGIK